MGFQSWMGVMGIGPAMCYGELDRQLGEYLEYLWESGDSKSLAADTLSGVQHFLRVKRVFSGGWSLFKAWGKLELPNRAPPLPELVLTGMVGLAFSLGRHDLASLLLIGFGGFLRTGEILSLRSNMLNFDWQTGTLIIALPESKSGLRFGVQEVVTIPDRGILRLVWLFVCHLPPGGALFTGSAQRFRDDFQRLLVGLGFGDRSYRPYSLRRGGATAELRRGTPLDNLMLRGRWSSLSTARIYLNEGLSLLAQLHFTNAERASLADYTAEVVRRLEA